MFARSYPGERSLDQVLSEIPLSALFSSLVAFPRLTDLSSHVDLAGGEFLDLVVAAARGLPIQVEEKFSP